MVPTSKIYVAGHTGLVGSALMRKLHTSGYKNLVTKSFQELDLRRQGSVECFFEQEKPEYVFLAAAKVGGILANNTYKAEFIYDNLMIAANVIHASYKFGVKKLLNLGSSCIYPKNAPQPLKEEYLLSGLLEPTNEPYAIAKIAAIKLCRYYNEQFGTNFISAMPTNLYGPQDNFDINTAHVIPALINKFHQAKKQLSDHVVLWGTGKPYREFLYVDDLADALIFLMMSYDTKAIGECINVGSESEISIKELALHIKAITGFNGEIVHDLSKPDGIERKLLDASRIKALGWVPKILLENGLKFVYQWYVRQGVDTAFGFEKESRRNVSL